jgi:hypothetical protein
MSSNPVRMPPHHYLNDGYGIKSWLLTRDHKRIAIVDQSNSGWFRRGSSSVRRGVLPLDHQRGRVRLCELVDRDLETANHHRGYLKALSFLGRIVENVLKCRDIGSVSHKLL